MTDDTRAILSTMEDIDKAISKLLSGKGDRYKQLWEMKFKVAGIIAYLSRNPVPES